MPSWASAAIPAPWAVVVVVAILVAGRVVDKVLDIVKIQVLKSSKMPLVVHRSKDEETAWVWPEQDVSLPDVKPPPESRVLRSVDRPDLHDPPARSG